MRIFARNLCDMKEKMAAEDFREIERGYSMAEAMAEAKRCLNCKKPLCVEGCPISHDIPAFINSMSKGNFGEAMSIINTKSNLPAICGRVCPHEKQCEGHCVLNSRANPIKVGKLERFVADFDSRMGLIRERLPQKTRGKVAVIGAGPAGLTVAGDLAKEGFNVVVYEGQGESGGVLLYGIPEYRLPHEIVRREVGKIGELGVTFLHNYIVGQDITVDEMFEHGFNAVFIGTGTAIPKVPAVPGVELHHVIQSLYFLRMVYLYNSQSVTRDKVPIREGERVAVMGAGNVAMDAARSAIRMGAKSVTMVYYKGIENMSALRTEYEEALAEGVEFMWNTNVTEFIGDDGMVARLRVATPEGERLVDVDRVMLAIGSKPANKIVSTTLGIDVDDSGYVKTTSHPYGMTTRKGVFAGGDVVHTPQTVVLAMREAKEVAKGIAKYVDAVKLLE